VEEEVFKMSGSIYESICPRCGRSGMKCCSETKPFDQSSGECFNCGFTYYTIDKVLTRNELKELQENNEHIETPLTEEEKKSIKEFDIIW